MKRNVIAIIAAALCLSAAAQTPKNVEYAGVYYIKCTSAASDCYAPTVDGVHPDNYGYYLWYKSIEKPLCKILRKYGIK